MDLFKKKAKPDAAVPAGAASAKVAATRAVGPAPKPEPPKTEPPSTEQTTKPAAAAGPARADPFTALGEIVSLLMRSANLRQAPFSAITDILGPRADSDHSGSYPAAVK